MAHVRTALVSSSSLVSAATAVVAPVLRRQAATARRRIGKPLGEIPWDGDRLWRARLEGEPIRLAVLGDSIAAGLGASRRKHTLGARLARALADHEQRPVFLRTAAEVGAESSALAAQLDELECEPVPDLAVIVVGGNDVTHRVPLAHAVQDLEDAVGRLRARGAAVVVGTCPDLGALRAVPQPLRSLAARSSRRLAERQATAAVRSGARVVSLSDTVGPMFAARPEEMFSIDRFHPSSTGYRRTAEAMLPILLEVWSERTQESARAAG